MQSLLLDILHLAGPVQVPYKSICKYVYRIAFETASSTINGAFCPPKCGVNSKDIKLFNQQRFEHQSSVQS